MSETLLVRESIDLRDPGPRVLLGERPPAMRAVNWGYAWQHGTAAYWADATVHAKSDGRIADDVLRHRLGDSLREEVAACILGGWGMPYEMGLAAFRRVRGEGLLRPGATPTEGQLLGLLSESFVLHGRHRKYRFANQRSARLVQALAFVDRSTPPALPREIRDWLTCAPGIGLKTASWIVRNHWGADDVAVLDVHVVRAGLRAGVFPAGATPERHYRVLEELFLAWAAHGEVRASDLDAVIWAEEAFWARSGRLSLR